MIVSDYPRDRVLQPWLALPACVCPADFDARGRRWYGEHHSCKAIGAMHYKSHRPTKVPVSYLTNLQTFPRQLHQRLIN